MPNPACVAYEAYRDYMNQHVNDWGTYLLRWQDLPEAQQRAWFAAVAALAKMHTAQKEAASDQF